MSAGKIIISNLTQSSKRNEITIKNPSSAKIKDKGIWI